MHNTRNSPFAKSLIPALKEKQSLESLSLSVQVSHSSVQLTEEEKELRDGGSLTKSYVSSVLSDVSCELSAVMTEINTYRRKGGIRWRIVCSMVCLWFSYLFLNSAFSIIAPFFPFEALKKGSSPIFNGIIIGAGPLGVMIFSPITGYLLPKLNVRFMVFIGLLLVGGTFLLLGFTPMLPSGWIFITLCIILRSAEGIGTALFITAFFTLVSILYPHSVGTLMGIIQVAGGLGYCLGSPIGGFLYQVGGFRLPFIAVGGIILLVGVPSTLLVPRTESIKKHMSEASSVFKLVTNFTFLVLVSVGVLSLAGFSFLAPNLELFLDMEYQLTPVEIGLVFFSGSIVFVLTCFVVGPLSDKFGPRYFLIAGQVMFGIVFFFFGPPEFISSPKIWITCTAYSFIGLASAITITPVYLDMLDFSKRNIFKEENHATMISVVSGICASSISTGMFLGPLFGGALAQAFSLQTSCIIMSEIFIAELPKLNVRFMVFIGLLLVGGTFFLLGFTPMLPSGWTFITLCIILRSAEGIGTALFITAFFTLVSILYPHSVGTLMGFIQVAGGLGYCLGSPIGVFLYQVGGFRLPFIAVGGIILLVGVPSTLLVPRTESIKKHMSEASSVFKLVTNFTFLVLVSVGVLSLAGFSFVAPILELFLDMEYQLTPVEIGLVFFSGSIVFVLTCFVVGPLSDKFGPRYFLIAGQVMFGIVFFFFGPPEFISSPKIWITCTAYSFIGLASAITITPVYLDMLDF